MRKFLVERRSYWLSYIVSPNDSFYLLATDGAPCDWLIGWLVKNGPSSTCLAHDSMTAVQEDCVDLATKADVAVVERLLLLLEQVCQLVYLLLQHYYSLA